MSQKIQNGWFIAISGLDTSWCQVVAQRASSFRQLLALSLVIQVLSVHSIKGECNFFVAPRASIPGDLLALSDFYWPRANGPTGVSVDPCNFSHFMSIILPGGHVHISWSNLLYVTNNQCLDKLKNNGWEEFQKYQCISIFHILSHWFYLDNTTVFTPRPRVIVVPFVRHRRRVSSPSLRRLLATKLEK